MTTLWLKLQGYGYTLLAVLLVLIGAYAAGGRKAKKAAETTAKVREQAIELKATKAAVESAQTNKEVSSEVEAMAPGEARQKLENEWGRE